MVASVDWTTVSSLATAAGTLVLAVATFAAVRSSNRSARIAELALQEQRRPLFHPSRYSDPMQKISFMEGNWVRAEGGRAAIEYANGTVYMAISLRNVGSGIGVCQGWTVWAGRTGETLDHFGHTPLDQFNFQARDLFIPAGDIGMWQGALRNPDDPTHAAIVAAIENCTMVQVELLYSDQVGGERTITRFGLSPMEDGSWLCGVSRHFYLDWAGPRSDDMLQAAADRIRQEREASEQRNGDSDLSR